MTLKKVTYYSLQIEGEESSMFLNFVNNHIDEFEDCVFIIRAWLQEIGKKYGAQERFFRVEAFRGGDARALPPPAKQKYRLPKFIDVDCNLRLYCMRINERVVILFDGAEKTAATPQECDKVRPHFLLANRITKVIDKAIIEDREITYDEYNDLVYDEDFLIEIK